MKIHCAGCRDVLKDEDVVIMDQMNGLTHKFCYDLVAEWIKDVDTYQNLKEKYWFFREKVTH
jgi:hypothetical protein